MRKTKHMIWSNINLDVDDWKADFLERDPNMSENEMYQEMVYLNDSNLEDRREDLDIGLGKPILVIADLGLWHGRKPGYKFIHSGNISDCFYDDAEFCEWYVDGYGNMRGVAHHHDGTNHYLYRTIKDNISEERLDMLLDDIVKGRATSEKISATTESVGKYVANVYGWSVRGTGRKPKKKCVA